VSSGLKFPSRPDSNGPPHLQAHAQAPHQGSGAGQAVEVCNRYSLRLSHPPCSCLPRRQLTSGFRTHIPCPIFSATGTVYLPTSLPPSKSSILSADPTHMTCKPERGEMANSSVSIQTLHHSFTTKRRRRRGLRNYHRVSTTTGSGVRTRLLLHFLLLVLIVVLFV
jgi:hypothetical protein